MARNYGDYDDEFEMRRREPEEQEYPLRDERRVSRRRRIGEEETKKAPLIIRLIAWAAVIVFCFVAGYVGTSMALRFLDRKDILERKDVVSGREEAGELLAREDGKIELNARKVTFSVYYPRGGGLVSENDDFISGIMEDDIQQAINKIFSLIPGKFPADVQLINIFRTGDTVFLNFNSAFVSGLAKLGENESALFITAVVRTMKENFTPITKVRFLVNGKVTRKGSPVDLTVPWQLPQG